MVRFQGFWLLFSGLASGFGRLRGPKPKITSTSNIFRLHDVCLAVAMVADKFFGACNTFEYVSTILDPRNPYIGTAPVEGPRAPSWDVLP